MKNTNMKFTILILIIIILIVLFCKNDTLENYAVYRESMYNSNMYKVQEYNKNSQDAANLLGKINIFIKKIKDHLMKKYPDDKRVTRMNNRLREIELIEPEHKNDESAYTINKGELMALCLRKKDNKEFYDMEMMSFVVIHELAHVMTISEGHTPEFMENFRFILKEAENAELYEPINYSFNPTNYCGVDVTHNPFFNHQNN